WSCSLETCSQPQSRRGALQIVLAGLSTVVWSTRDAWEGYQQVGCPHCIRGTPLP
ncbi:hypothetical protein TGPRC2_427760, partial [Toxoplasma gondii TgCatPRC2]